MYMIQDLKKLGVRVQDSKELILLTAVLLILLILAMGITSCLMDAIRFYLFF
jgi:hypothetical protein